MEVQLYSKMPLVTFFSCLRAVLKLILIVELIYFSFDQRAVV